MRNAGLDELQAGITGFKLNVKIKTATTKIMAPGPITSWQEER